MHCDIKQKHIFKYNYNLLRHTQIELFFIFVCVYVSLCQCLHFVVEVFAFSSKVKTFCKHK